MAASSCSRMDNTMVFLNTTGTWFWLFQDSFVDFVNTYPLLYASEYMNYQIFDQQKKVLKT